MGLSIPVLQAQTRVNDFTLGNQLLREGAFEEAYDIFSRLLQEHPRSYSIYERAYSALIGMKAYEEAIEITKKHLEHNSRDINVRIKLGQTYHMAGKNEKALETWDQLLELHAENPAAYQRLAEALNQRRLYREAIDVYNRARRKFNNLDLFAFEIANNYLAVGDFESAINEYLDIIQHNDRQKSRIQRQLLNYDERELYDISILLTEERIERFTPGSERDLNFRDFLVWLNMERELYRRALTAARTLERYSENQRHVLFRIGRQLRSQQQFDLAEEAFSYYLDLEHHPLQARSYEELSRTYLDRATDLVDNNLDFGTAADVYYRKAFDTVERLTYRYPRYDRLMETLVIQAELALDHLKEPDAAEKYLEKMKDVAQDDSDNTLLHYVKGRILLFRGDFTMARVEFTRSHRISGSAEIANKSRYYLGLGDFYNEEFDYSRLQLRSLERQTHSWFANNALQLRYMIQQAWEQDGDNEPLKRYARARYLYDTGHYAKSAELLIPVLNEPWQHPIHNESILLLTRVLRRIHPEIAFQVIDRHTRRPSVQQHAGEQLLWERARLAEQVYMMHYLRENTEGMLTYTPPSVLVEDIFDGTQPFSGPGSEPVLLTADMVIGYYEDLLMNYSDGYYSDLSRSRIRELEQKPREI